MNRRLPFFFLLIASLALFSCGEEPFKAELKQIDQLHRQIDSIEVVFKSLDLEDAVAKGVQIRQDAQALKMYAENYPEAFTSELGTLIDDLRAANKVYGSIEKNHAKMAAEIKYSRKQLEHLKGDYKKHKFKLEEGRNHFQTEKKAIKELVMNIDQLKLNSKIGVVKYDRQLDLINDYKSRQN